MNGDIGYLLKVIQDGMERRMNQFLKPVDLTSSQVHVLKYLGSRGEEKVTQKQIEEYLQVSHPTVVGILKRLEQKGFVRTEFEGNDRRRKYVYRTHKEKELFCRMVDSHNMMENLLTQGMSEAQICQLHQLLAMVYENVKREETEIC